MRLLVPIYSVFDSALYRNLDAKWLFPLRGPHGQVVVRGVEVKATLHDLKMATLESKTLSYMVVLACQRSIAGDDSRRGGA
jgi:hypothetical protein